MSAGASGDRSEPAGASGGAGASWRGKPPREGARVLLIDDEPMLLRAIRRSLSTEAEVVAAASGGEGLAVLESDRDFDVVFCDLLMPEVSGIAVYERVGKLDPGLQRRVVFLTGGAVAERAHAFLAGIENAVVEKPPDVGILRDLIRRYGADPA